MYLIEFLLVGWPAAWPACWWAAATMCCCRHHAGGNEPPPSLHPALQGRHGMLLLAAFALPPILQLRKVPHNRVIRREQEPPQVARWPPTAGTAFCALLLWQAGDAQLALYTALGFLRVRLFALVGWLGLAARCAAARPDRSPELALCLTSLQRRPGATWCRSRWRWADGAAGADGGARRPDDGLAQRHAGRCAQPLHHQHPARAAATLRAGCRRQASAMRPSIR
jgi:putative ABC transport system permease protein